MLMYSIVTALAALTTPVFPLAISHLPRTETGLDIQLTAVGNTRIKAVITNTADRHLNLLKFNSFLDDGPTHKVGIFKNGNPVKFEGMLRRIQTSNLPRSVFVSIGPGESIEKEFDIASTADLAAGGTFGVSSQGIIPFAEGNGTTLTGGAAFRTNHLDLDIDGAVAATVSKAIQPLSRRTEVDGSCSGERKSALLKALRGSASLASSAAKAARSNSKKVQEYFLQDDQETINAVVARLQAIARESGSTTSGATRYYCDDTQNRCEPGVLAYTLPSQNTVTNCPSFYDLPIISKECHAQCQASTVLHELTHNPGVYEPFCEDHAYGYDSIRRLSSRQALNNADSFSLFANAIYAGC